eukprot:CAMPEP_0202897364 /NCGR_PEP_ID=MMETSP1392-20130828/6142_1 /ASSEMBLY_ACC=CAM_ASM_000868 /TAXON_ID=225041 /ORGANISM="Chlamydomonas chlamydogama, Strain SAG 11-48b" /LENGTH=79 /DNA_ID=CAMNT_0049582973 /DNA_START=282 /DNA_END=521 /DNA_ORIENTATION=+
MESIQSLPLEPKKGDLMTLTRWSCHKGQEGDFGKVQVIRRRGRIPVHTECRRSGEARDRVGVGGERQAGGVNGRKNEGG